MADEKKQLNKEVSQAFGKKIYLLFQDDEGTNHWLEEPKWDCGWYWGFGYVETYTNNNNPSRSRDIESHQHFDGFFMKEIDGKFIHNIYDNPKITRTTFTEKEGWILSELMQSFYTLRKTAEMFHTGGAHITTNPVKEVLQRPDLEKEINEVMIPAVTKAVTELLTFKMPVVDMTTEQKPE